MYLFTLNKFIYLVLLINNLLDAKIFGLNDPERTRWASGGRWLGLGRNVPRLFDEFGIGPMCRLRWTSVKKGKKYYFLSQLKLYYVQYYRQGRQFRQGLGLGGPDRGEFSTNKSKSFCSTQSFRKNFSKIQSSFFLNRIFTSWIA